MQAHRFSKIFQTVVMLISQNFGWGHHTGLGTVGNGQQHRNKRYNGFAASHVSLQEPVHLLACVAVGIDFAKNPLLGTGQRKGYKLS